MKWVHLPLIKICWSVPCKAWSFSRLSSKLQQFAEHEIHCLYGLRQCFLKTLLSTTPRKINSPFLSRSPLRSINGGLRKWVSCQSFCHASMVMLSTHRKLLGALARTCNPSVGCEDSGWVWGLLASYLVITLCLQPGHCARCWCSALFVLFIQPEIQYVGWAVHS